MFVQNVIYQHVLFNEFNSLPTPAEVSSDPLKYGKSTYGIIWVMSPAPSTLPTPNEYLPNRKLFSYLLLCHKLNVEFTSSFSIPEPIPHRTFLSGSRKYVQKIIDFELIDPGATMLDFFLKTDHKPVRLELSEPCTPGAAKQTGLLSGLGAGPGSSPGYTRCSTGRGWHTPRAGSPERTGL